MSLHVSFLNFIIKTGKNVAKWRTRSWLCLILEKLELHKWKFWYQCQENLWPQFFIWFSKWLNIHKENFSHKIFDGLIVKFGRKIQCSSAFGSCKKSILLSSFSDINVQNFSEILFRFFPKTIEKFQHKYWIKSRPRLNLHFPNFGIFSQNFSLFFVILFKSIKMRKSRKNLWKKSSKKKLN
jgi:hypothetical protein